MYAVSSCTSKLILSICESRSPSSSILNLMLYFFFIASKNASLASFTLRTLAKGGAISYCSQAFSRFDKILESLKALASACLSACFRAFVKLLSASASRFSKSSRDIMSGNFFASATNRSYSSEDILLQVLCHFWAKIQKL
nr:BB_Q62-like protein [Borreliella burgdorferi N40]